MELKILKMACHSFIYSFFFNFTILYWFCHISTWIRHGYTRVPHPKPSSLLPPREGGWCLWVVPMHQPQASSIMHRTWTGDSFHIWYYTCYNAILPNHPTLSLSHRVQKTVLYISVSFAVSYTGLLLPSFFYLNPLEGRGYVRCWEWGGQPLSEETTKQLFTQRNHYSHKKLYEREVTEAVRHIRGSWLGWGLRNGFSEEGTFEWRSAGRVHCCRKRGLRRRKGGKAGAEQEWQLEVPRWVEAGEANHYNVQSCKALQLVFRVLTLSPRTIRSHCLKGVKLGSRY